MTVFINNQEVATEAAHLAALLAERALPNRGVAVAVNNKIAPRTAWEATPLADGDRITIIKAACGG